MTSYDYTDSHNPQWVGDACRANLSTGIIIKSPSDKTVQMSSKKTDMAIWDEIPPNSTIEYNILTKSDGKGMSDRVNVELQIFDMVYIGEITNQILDTLSDEDLDLALTDIDAFTKIMEPKIEESLDPNQVFKVLFSDIAVTNESGVASGTIPLPIQYPAGQYNLMFHYGYDAQSEASDSAKAKDFWLKTVAPLVLEIAFSVIAVAFPPAIAVAAAAATYDVAKMGTEYYTTRFGIAGENQHGCIFPVNGGFNHTYTFNIEPLEEAAQLSEVLSPENADIVSSMNAIIQLKGLGKVVLAGSVVTLVLLTLLNRLKGGRES